MEEAIEKRQEMACPLNGKCCINGRREDFPVDKVGSKLSCRWWTWVKGMHPQTGKEMSHWDCAVAWMPVNILEAAHQSSYAAAEVHSLVNGIAAIVPPHLRMDYIKATGGTSLPQLSADQSNLLDKKPDGEVN